MKTKLKTLPEKEKLLRNKNFLNSQNYLVTSEAKKNIKYGLLAYFNENNNKNEMFLDRTINFINRKDIKIINKSNFYFKTFFTYIILFAIIIGFFYIGNVLTFISIYFAYFVIKGIKNLREILNFEIYVGKNDIITLNKKLSISIDKKIDKLSGKNLNEQIQIIKKNFNLLNNQNYIFGKKLENKISKGFSSLVNFQKLEKFYFFTMKQINDAYIQKKILKFLVFFFFFGIIIIILFMISMLFFGSYWYIGLMLELGILIYYIFIHKSKLNNFKIVYDKDIIYFIEK